MKGKMIERVIEYLKTLGIESFERMGILVVPVSSPDEIYDTAERLRRIFKEIGYDKSWRIDPYYLSDQESLRREMYGGSNEQN